MTVYCFLTTGVWVLLMCLKLSFFTLNQLNNYSGTIMLNFQFVIARVKFLLILEMCCLSFAHECRYSSHWLSGRLGGTDYCVARWTCILSESYISCNNRKLFSICDVLYVNVVVVIMTWLEISEPHHLCSGSARSTWEGGLVGMSDLGPKLVRMAPNGTNPGLLQIRFQYILALIWPYLALYPSAFILISWNETNSRGALSKSQGA